MELTKAKELAQSLMKEHKIDNTWVFRFDRGRRRFGLCSHSNRVISLSHHLTALNSEEHVKDILLHEIAHALVGPSHGHDHVWHARASAIGCSSTRCHSSEVIQPPAKLVGTCPTCGSQIHRNKRSRRGMACSKCCNQFNGGKYDAKYSFVWTQNS